jgi:cytokinin trans-hydroxylase
MNSVDIYFGDRKIWSALCTSLLTALLMWVAYIVLGTVNKFVITPMRIKRIMNSQGVKGPSSHLLLGNLPEMTMLKEAATKNDMKTGDYDIVSRVLPFHVQNCQAYGKSYLWWFGWEPRITITDLDLIKQVLPNKDHAFTKSQMMLKFIMPVIGKGLVTTDGEEWALHRRIVNPAFHHEKLKAMVIPMEKSASSMADEWEKKVRDGGGNVELEVGDYMTRVTADIIALTAFGSNYEKGKKVFEQQVALINLTDQRYKQQFSAIPGYRFLSSHFNLIP